MVWIGVRNGDDLHCLLADKSTGVAGAKHHPGDVVPV
jgi:hypothetical protein